MSNNKNLFYSKFSLKTSCCRTKVPRTPTLSSLTLAWLTIFAKERSTEAQVALHSTLVRTIKKDFMQWWSHDGGRSSTLFNFYSVHLWHCVLWQDALSSLAAAGGQRAQQVAPVHGNLASFRLPSFLSEHVLNRPVWVRSKLQSCSHDSELGDQSAVWLVRSQLHTLFYASTINPLSGMILLCWSNAERRRDACSLGGPPGL